MAYKVKPYTLKELAALYDVDDRTIRNWIEPFKAEIGKKNGNYYSVIQVRIIFTRLGVPN